MRTCEYITNIGFALALLFLYSCAMNPVTGKKQFVMMSERQEIAMGQASDPQIIAFFGSRSKEGNDLRIGCLTHRDFLPL